LRDATELPLLPTFLVSATAIQRRGENRESMDEREVLLDMWKKEVESYRAVIREDRRQFRDYFARKRKGTHNGSERIAGYNEAIDEMVAELNRVMKLL